MRNSAFAILILSIALTSSAAAAPLKIMALGDSITHGVDGASPTGDTSAGGYRPLLANRFVGGIEIEWIGRYTDGPPIAKRHEGWNGYTIRQIDNNIIADAFAEGIPDILLLMIGTNDAWNAPMYNDPLTTRERMLENLHHLLQNIQTRAPQTRVVLSTITPLGFPHPLAEAARETYNNGLDEMVQEFQGNNMNIGLVNAGGRVPPILFPDGVHPNAAGYQLIADGFFEAFVLPNTPEPASGLALTAAVAVICRRTRVSLYPRRKRH